MPKNKNKANNQKRKGQSRPMRRKKPAMRRAPKNSGLMISHCAAKYAAALSEPFGPLAQGACIPRFPAVFSHKVAVVAKFQVRTGTSGDSFINVCPTPWNDKPCAFTCNGNWTGSTSTADVKSTDTGVITITHNGPYAKPSSDVIKARIVAVAIRVIPIMSVTNMSGLVTTTSGNTHQNLNHESFSQNSTLPSSSTTRTSNKGVFVSTAGLKEDDFTYSTSDYPYNSEAYSTDPADSATGGAVLQYSASTDTSGQPSWCELIMHVEYTGLGIGATGTPSHADPVGFSAVASAQTKVHNVVAGTNNASSSGYASSFKRVLGQVLSELTPSPAQIAGGAKVAGRIAIGKGLSMLASSPGAGTLALI